MLTYFIRAATVPMFLDSVSQCVWNMQVDFVAFISYAFLLRFDTPPQKRFTHQCRGGDGSQVGRLYRALMLLMNSRM